jgi:hypothetical protein
MSIPTLSARMRVIEPQDEMIGSLTTERVALAVRYAGGQVIDGPDDAKRWLAWALNTDIPYGAWDQLSEAFQTAHYLEDADLDYWYDVPNTLANREAMLRHAELIIDSCVESLSRLLCAQLGVTA